MALEQQISPFGENLNSIYTLIFLWGIDRLLPPPDITYIST